MQYFFITLLLSNILLTLINRSFQYPLITTILYKNKLLPLIIGIVLLLIILILNISFINNLFQLVPLSLTNLSDCIILAMIGTLWIEGWKILKLKIKKVITSFFSLTIG